MVQAGRPWCGLRGAAPRPGVQADMMVVAARRQEHGVPAVCRGHLEAQDVAVEGEGAVQVRHGQMDVADTGFRIDHVADLGLWIARSEEHTSELQSLAYLVCRLLLEKKNRT